MGMAFGADLCTPFSALGFVPIVLIIFDRKEEKVCVMESHVMNAWRLPVDRYAKTNFRAHQAALSYPEKVRQVIEMQRRQVPIYAARGQKIVPWKI